MTERGLVLTRKSMAAAYEFHGGGTFGWAICTINNSTGELHIQSDWGNWQYRWSTDPRNLGCANLTEFMATRDAVDYVANKLQREGKDGRRWSAHGTAAALRKLLCKRRMKAGRDSRGKHWKETHNLTKGRVRDLWDELGDLAAECGGCDDSNLFYSRYLECALAEYITPEPWEYAVYKQTPEDKALREAILPALFNALREESK